MACNDTPSGLIQKPEKFSYIEAKRADFDILATCGLSLNVRPNCQSKIPSPDSLLNHGGNLPNGVSLGFDVLQVWVQINGGAWQQLGTSTLPYTGTQNITPHTLASAASPGVSQEFLDAMNAAFASDSEINQYLFAVTLPTNPSHPQEVCVAADPSVTNFVLVGKRNQDDGASENWIWQQDTSANPVSSNPGSSFWYDTSETLPAGDPDAAGFWTNFTKYNGQFDPSFRNCSWSY